MTEAGLPRTIVILLLALVVAAASDATGVAELLGRYAASVDAGEDPAAAFDVLSGAAGLAES